MKKQIPFTIFICLIVLNFIFTYQVIAKPIEEDLMLSDIVEGELTKDDDILDDGYFDQYILDTKLIEEESEVVIVLKSSDFIPQLYLVDRETDEIIMVGKEKTIKNAKYSYNFISFQVNPNLQYLVRAAGEADRFGNYRLTLCSDWVTNTNDNGSGSLREAVSHPFPFGAICFDPDIFNDSADPDDKTIYLESEITMDQNVSIVGSGKENAIISGNSSTRVFMINENVNVKITHLTITNGNSANDIGGGIRNHGSLILIKSSIKNNRRGGICNYGFIDMEDTEIYSNDDGGIYNSDGSLNIKNSRIYSNTGQYGGGIDNYEGTLYIEDSYVGYNSAILGGGIEGEDSDIEIQNTLIENNTAYEGGGVELLNGTLVVGGSSLIKNNFARDYGGGISVKGSAFIRDKTSIQNNIAKKCGGGIFNMGTLVVENNNRGPGDGEAISGNLAAEGGGIYNLGDTTISDNMITNNGAWVNGGGVYNLGSFTLVQGSNIQNNDAQLNGGGIYNDNNGGGIIGCHACPGIVTILDTSSITENQANYGNVYKNGTGGGIFNANGSLNFDYSPYQHVFLNQPDDIIPVP